MKIKLDENLPAALAKRLRGLGHDVETVREEGLEGKKDDRIWISAQSEGRFLITQDLDLTLTPLLEPLQEQRIALHEGRHRVRIEDELHRRLGGFDFRACRTEVSSSSTAAAVSESIALNCSKKPGDQSDSCLNSLSRARTISRFRLILRARALRSTASRRGFGMWTLVAMTILVSILWSLQTWAR